MTVLDTTVKWFNNIALDIVETKQRLTVLKALKNVMYDINPDVVYSEIERKLNSLSILLNENTDDLYLPMIKTIVKSTHDKIENEITSLNNRIKIKNLIGERKFVKDFTSDEIEEIVNHLLDSIQQNIDDDKKIVISLGYGFVGSLSIVKSIYFRRNGETLYSFDTVMDVHIQSFISAIDSVLGGLTTDSDLVEEDF